MYQTKSAKYGYNPETDVVEITQNSSGFSVQLSFAELHGLFTTASTATKRTANLLNGTGELSRTDNHLHCKGGGINTYLFHEERQALRKYIFDKLDAYKNSKQNIENTESNAPWGGN